MKRKKIPYTLKQLNVSGRDMTSIGLRGRTVGEALHHLLYFAIRAGKNDKGSLMKEIKRKYRIAEEGYKNMKTFTSYMEAHRANKQDVPVYVPVPGKQGHHKVVGHVRRNATSVGAAKVAKSRSAFKTMKLVSPEYPEGPGWIAKK
jgi:ribosomal protein L44E